MTHSGMQPKNGLRVHILMAALAAILIVGCTSQGPNLEAQREAFIASFEAATGFPLSEAEENGIAPETRQVLERAVERAVLTPTDLNDAIENTLACFDDAGIPWERIYVEDHWGQPVHDFTFRAPPGSEDNDSWWLIADKCQASHSMFVQAVYDNQPNAVESRATWFESRQADVDECLDSHGTIAPAGADFDTYVTVAKELLDATGESTCLELLMG